MPQVIRSPKIYDVCIIGSGAAVGAVAGEEPDEVQGAGQSRARVSGDEAEVRIREGALPRAEEERAQVVVTCALVNLFMSRKKLLLNVA